MRSLFLPGKGVESCDSCLLEGRGKNTTNVEPGVLIVGGMHLNAPFAQAPRTEALQC